MLSPSSRMRGGITPCPGEPSATLALRLTHAGQRDGRIVMRCAQEKRRELYRAWGVSPRVVKPAAAAGASRHAR